MRVQMFAPPGLPGGTSAPPALPPDAPTLVVRMGPDSMGVVMVGGEEKPMVTRTEAGKQLQMAFARREAGSGESSVNLRAARRFSTMGLLDQAIPILEVVLSKDPRNPEAWDEYRRSTVSVLASRLSAAARSERPGIVVSAAVAPDEAQAVAQRFQAWPRWLSERLLDAVVPMAYTPDNRLFSAQVQQARTLVLAGQGLWAGIGAYRLDLPGIVEKIQLARESGAAGVVLFSHESLAPADLRRLREAAFTPAVAGAVTRSAGGGAGSR